jgi:hypothetical protein
MRYRISRPWPVGSVVIPGGTVIIDDDAQSGWASVVREAIPPPAAFRLIRPLAWLVSAYQLPDHNHEIAQVPSTV